MGLTEAAAVGHEPSVDSPAACEDTQSSQATAAAFEDFYRENFPRLVWFLCASGASPPDAEDAVAETMIALLARWGEVHAPRAWSHTVARRLYAQLRAREDDHRAQITNAIALDILGVVGRPAASHTDTVEQAEVVWLLRLLPQTQMWVLALEYDGFSSTEIAEMLEISVDTVRSHRRHGRKRLREKVSIR